VKDLDREVLALLTAEFLLFLFEDLPRAVVGVDNVIADGVRLRRRLTRYLEVLNRLLPLV
jgi:hypothetical protein